MDGYTTSAWYGAPLNDSYDTLESTWQGSTFDSDQSAGWIPYLGWGDISSLTAENMGVFEPFELWSKSCWDGDIQNCTSVCTDPSKLFVNSTAQGDNPKMSTNTTYNIFACMYYPILSKFLGGPAQPGNDSWEQLVLIGQDYNIVPNASLELVTDIVNTQTNCYVQYCYWQTTNFCPTYNISYDDDGNLQQQYQAMTGPGLLPAFPDWSTISTLDTMNINSDIGGVGVSIAYMIEFTLLGLTWLLLRYLRVGRRLKKRSLTLKGSQADSTLQPSNGFREMPHQRDGGWCRHLKMQRDVNDFLINFHQTQCWFFIALNLVVLLGLLGNTTIFGTSSLGQLDRNMAYAQCVLQGGVVFVTASMWLMLFEDYFYDEAWSPNVGKLDPVTEQLSRPSTSNTHGSKGGIEDTKKSIALWLLTLIAVTLGTTAWALSFQLDHPEKRIKPGLGNWQLPWTYSCGLISPATYNSERWDAEWSHRNHISERLPIFVYCWLLIAIMFASFFKRQMLKFWRRGHPYGRTMSWIQPLATHTWTKRVLIGIAELLMITCLAFFLRDYVIVMRPSLPQIDKTFSMGQMLAVFAWAPAIVGVYYMVWDWIAGATVETWKASRANTLNNLSVIAEPKANSHENHIRLTDIKYSGVQTAEVR